MQRLRTPQTLLGLVALLVLGLAGLARGQGAPTYVAPKPAGSPPPRASGPQLNRAIMKDIDGRKYTQWPASDCILRYRPWVTQDHRSTMLIENLHVHNVTNQKAIHIGMSSYDKPKVNGQIPTYLKVIVRNLEIDNVWRDAIGAKNTLHIDCILVNGGAPTNSFWPSIVFEDLYIHDTNAMTILVNEGVMNQIVIRRMKAERVATPIQIYPTGPARVNEVVIEDSPGIQVALEGDLGHIGRCIVRRSPGASVSNVRMGNGRQTKVPIIYQP